MRKDKARKRARILIVDDHPSVRERLAWRIGQESDLEVCGEATDLAEALRLVAETQPDVAVVDISLKSGNGMDLVRRIRVRYRRVRTLVWSMHSESLYAERALRAGALGYINKDQATEKIVLAIRRVLEGKVWLSESITERLLQRTIGTCGQDLTRSPLAALSDRELEVFRLIGQGVQTADIADRLHISVRNVATYRHRIREKLDLPDGTRLAQYATQWMLENG